MQYLGGKLSAAQLQVADWMGGVRRSLQGALELVWGHSEEKKQEEKEGDAEDGGDGEGRFQRAVSPLRNFARRSRRSLRRFTGRSRPPLQKRATETGSAQVNSYCTSDGDKDTDVLIDSEQEQQDGFCDQTTESESSNPDQFDFVEDVDAAVFHREPELAPFPETFAPLLDTTAQRSRADLGKKRTRTRPPRSVGAGSAQTEKLDWRAQDSTDGNEESSQQRDSDSEEEQPKPKIASSPPAVTQRVPIFPGLKHADLIAQIKKRTCGGETGGGEAEEEKPRVERESRGEEAAPAPTPLPRSPRTPANLAGAALVLPPLHGNDGGAVSSPAWLKELKSKKRMSQHDIDA